MNSRGVAIGESGGSPEFSRSVHSIQTNMPNTLLQLIVHRFVTALNRNLLGEK